MSTTFYRPEKLPKLQMQGPNGPWKFQDPNYPVDSTRSTKSQHMRHAAELESTQEAPLTLSKTNIRLKHIKIDSHLRMSSAAHAQNLWHD